MELLGYIFSVIIAIYATVFVFFVTVSTSSPGMFVQKEWYLKLLAVILWASVLWYWCYLLSMLSIK